MLCDSKQNILSKFSSEINNFRSETEETMNHKRAQNGWYKSNMRKQ